MTARNSDSAHEARMHAAAEWLIHLHEHPTDSALLADWLKWRSEHPDNSRCFDAVEEIWTLSGNCLPDAPTAQAQSAASSTIQPRPATSRYTLWGGAAALAATLLFAVMLWRGNQPDSHVPAAQYTTAQAIEREVQLSDSSTITLGGASSVRVAYSAARRDVHLLQGEAFFEVQHDRRRPFVVHTPDLAVTAVGTAFNVRADAGRTVVVVSEGVVEIEPQATQQPKDATVSSLRAAAGQLVSLDAAQDTLAIQLSDAPLVTDWQDGVLSFVDEPLRTVVVRVNRYATHDILLGDSRVGDLRFTGTVFRDRIEDWASGLERAFPVRATAHADGSITLQTARQ